MGDVEHGKKVFKKCAACHSIKKGGGKKNWTSIVECSFSKSWFSN